VPILPEAEPDDGILILEGDLEPKDLRVEADRPIQVGHVQIDVSDSKRPDHPPSLARRVASAINQTTRRSVGPRDSRQRPRTSAPYDPSRDWRKEQPEILPSTCACSSPPTRSPLEHRKPRDDAWSEPFPHGVHAGRRMRSDRAAEDARV